MDIQKKLLIIAQLLVIGILSILAVVSYSKNYTTQKTFESFECNDKPVHSESTQYTCTYNDGSGEQKGYKILVMHGTGEHVDTEYRTSDDVLIMSKNSQFRYYTLFTLFTTTAILIFIRLILSLLIKNEKWGVILNVVFIGSFLCLALYFRLLLVFSF